jgi:hypothetical protein
MQRSPGLIHDYLLGAACIGHQRVSAHQRVEFAQGVENAIDRLREEQEVAEGAGFFERRAAIDSAPGNSLVDTSRGTDPEDGAGKFRPAKGESEGTSDQSNADDGDVFQMVRPTAGAMIRICFINWANCSG